MELLVRLCGPEMRLGRPKQRPELKTKEVSRSAFGSEVGLDTVGIHTEKLFDF